MKYSVYIILSFLFLFIIILTASCKHDHAHDEQGGHAAEDHAHEEKASIGAKDEHNHQKSVHLNEAQYINAGIDTGWFEMKNLSDVIHANGHTKLDPQDQADVGMPVSGTIKSINIIEGDYVRRGQTLATMSSMDYHKMKLQRAELKQELSVAQASKNYLKQEYDRQEELAAAQVNAQKVFQKVSADLKMELARISGIEKQMDILDGIIAMVNQSGSSNNIRIVAPISGYITMVNVKIGTLVDVGQILFSIVDNSKMHVDLLVYEKDLGAIKVGQRVRFILTNQSNTEINGTIYNIGKAFESNTKSVAVHADIEKNDANLIPGMYVNALIDIGSDLVQTLSTDAVVMAEGRQFIFLWERDNAERKTSVGEHDHDGGEDHDHDEATPEEITFTRLEVKTGATQLGDVQITLLGDIRDGDKIVTQGAYYLQSHLQKSEGGGGHSH